MNKVGQQVKSAGMQFGYHNHGNEWKTIDGVLGYEKWLRSVDPKLVQLQMDLGGTVSSGHDPARYLEANPGRFCSLHAKDAKSGQPPAGSLELGQRDVNWTRLFAASKKRASRITSSRWGSGHLKIRWPCYGTVMRIFMDCARRLRRLTSYSFPTLPHSGMQSVTDFVLRPFS